MCCSLCRRKFLLSDIQIQAWKKFFLRHMLSNRVTSGLKCTEIFTCQVCPTLPKFRTNSQLSRHNSQVHQAGGSQACGQPGCEGLNFPSLQHRFHHNRNDPNFFPFACPQWGCATRFRHERKGAEAPHVSDTWYTENFSNRSGSSNFRKV